MNHRTSWLLFMLLLLIVPLFNGSTAAADAGQPQTCDPGMSVSDNGSCQPCWYVAGCYHGPDEMTDLITRSQHVYLDNLKIVFGDHYALLHGFTALIPSGQTLEVMGCGVYFSSDAAHFCQASRTVYLGLDFAWLLYQKYGPLTVIQIAMHEQTHSVQYSVGIVHHESDDQESTIAYENQADCGSGAGLGYLNTQVRLPLQDIGEMNEYIAKILADRLDRPDRNHGTYQERLGAIMLGFTFGMKSCNQVYGPLVP